MDIVSLYKDVVLIRTFEKRVEKEFEFGKMRGTTHGCIGQELIPSIVMSKVNKKIDYITGTHRCHGQVLAYTHDPYRLACEMMGKADGFNMGMGGSQHIKIDNYITNGVTGGMASVGVGMALSIKNKKRNGVVISFLGDGGFQEGYVLETMNMASVFSVPIVYILENNGYAMSTKTDKLFAGSIEKRVKALDITYYHCDTRDIQGVDNAVTSAYEYTMNNLKPSFVHIDTFRLCGHSKSDTMEYMDEEERQRNVLNDPLIQLEKYISDETLTNGIKSEINMAIDQAFRDATECRQIGIKEYRNLMSDRGYLK